MLVHLLAPIASRGRCEKRSGRIRRTNDWICSRVREHRLFAGRTSAVRRSNPERVRGEVVTDRYPGILGITSTWGGPSLAPKPTGLASQAVAMIGHALWTRRYGADPAIVGRTIQVNSAPYTVVGVLPPVSGD